MEELTNDPPLIQFINSVWDRILEVYLIHIDFVFDLIPEAKNMAYHPLFALVEYAHGLDIPDAVFDCSSIKEIERIGVDFVVLQNDMLSYCKEEEDGVEHNMVAVCRNAGMSAQAAYDHMGDLLKQRYRDWYLALAGLPSWAVKSMGRFSDTLRACKESSKPIYGGALDPAVILEVK
ncbi:terpene synthase metal binding domain protein [Penicillium malachiteum]|uniref:Terpene synthase metal binding domain protein n=1 Tax=Penicillium malachiteum TaxID=1324776 RepID=A0AAD6MVP9_9EURO|nr:terpene synthase metal binding domain protein [Penicillium malachiteum]